MCFGGGGFGVVVGVPAGGGGGGVFDLGVVAGGVVGVAGDVFFCCMMVLLLLLLLFLPWVDVDVDTTVYSVCYVTTCGDVWAVLALLLLPERIFFFAGVDVVSCVLFCQI